MLKVNQNQCIKAEYFRQLHYQDTILVLPNAWDALSAKMIELAGAKALATTSAGMAACMGYPDGEQMPLKLFFMLIKRIIASVNIPVTVDIESGLGESIKEVCANVSKLIELGVVGINIEDSYCNELIPINIQASKIMAIKNLALQIQFPLFINARIDHYWLGISEQTIFTETIQRIQKYQYAGADGIFIPGLNDLPIIKQLKEHTHLPINILTNLTNSSLDDLKLHGVSRLSSGSSCVRSIANVITNMAQQMLDSGTSDYFKQAISYNEMNKYFE